MKLYEINTKIEEITALFESGEIDQDAFNDTMESLEMDFDSKMENIVSLIKHKENEAEAIAKEIKALQQRKKSKEREIESLSNYAYGSMKRTQKTNWECSKHKLTVAKTPAALKIVNEEQLILTLREKGLEDFIERKEIIRKTELKQYIKSVDLIDGCSLESGEKLRIK